MLFGVESDSTPQGRRMKSCVAPASGYVRYRNGELGIVFGSQNKDMAEELNRKSMDKVDLRNLCTSDGSTS